MPDLQQRVQTDGKSRAGSHRHAGQECKAAGCHMSRLFSVEYDVNDQISVSACVWSVDDVGGMFAGGGSGFSSVKADPQSQKLSQTSHSDGVERFQFGRHGERLSAHGRYVYKDGKILTGGQTTAELHTTQ